MAFEPTTFHDDAPPAVTAAELHNFNAGIAEAKSAAAAAQAAAAAAQAAADAVGEQLSAPRVIANWKLSNTAKLRASLAKAKLGTGLSTHVVVGDSLSSPFTGAAFDFPNSWWRKLWRGLVASGIPSAGTGRVAVTDSPAAPTSPIDPRITVSGDWANFGGWIESPAGGGTVTFTSDVPGTAVDVFYIGEGVRPDFTVTVDGGAPQTVTQSGPWRRETLSYTGLSNTTHTVTVTAAGTRVALFGFQVRQGSGLRFDNLGVKFGISAHHWANDPGLVEINTDYSPDADVVWIALGSNDFGEAGYAAGVTAIGTIRALWPAADAVLVIEPDAAGDTNYQAFVTAMRALSVTLDVPLIDLSLRHGTRAQISAAGLFGADNLHLNTVGQSDWAAIALDAIESVGPRVIA